MNNYINSYVDCMCVYLSPVCLSFEFLKYMKNNIKNIYDLFTYIHTHVHIQMYTAQTIGTKTHVHTQIFVTTQQVF